MSKLQAIRGMNDLLPSESPKWQYLESTVCQLLSSYAYQEIRFPLLEKTELFKRSIGEVTDIVEKEMYTFNDRNDESLTLRPEGTASCLRACSQHQLLNERNLPHKLWYTGPMFRYEKPQKGRLRQFHQIGVETYGLSAPEVDVELLLLSARLWQKLGISEHVSLQINSIGSLESRESYKAALVRFLESHFEELDEDSQRRLSSNPLRILDSKNENTQTLLNDAPSLFDYLDDESREHFTKVRSLLDAAGIRYEVNPRLVRGLDYYSKTVFEWVTAKLGAQGTVCAGGRYDGLVEQLGGKPTAAIGFAMGVERLILLMDTLDVFPASISQTTDVYIVTADGFTGNAFAVSELIHEHLPSLRVQMALNGGSIKSQMKKADKSGATFALILGEDEVLNKNVTVKPLRGGEQLTVQQSDIIEFLK